MYNTDFSFWEETNAFLTNASSASVLGILALAARAALQADFSGQANGRRTAARRGAARITKITGNGALQGGRRGLATRLSLRREDVFVSLIEVKRENWSFGAGIAQYA